MIDFKQVQRHIGFIIEVDRLKGVLRQTSPVGLERRENSAEHSWQVALCAIVFEEHASEPVDLLKVIKMLLIHDVVEVDVGDVFHYDKNVTENLYEKELAAAQRLFGLLDKPLGDELLSLWMEFEKKESPEARYACAIDRVIAFVMNAENQGGTWKKYGITPEQVLEKNKHIKKGSEALWLAANKMVEDVFA